MLGSKCCQNLPSLGNVTIFELLSRPLRKSESTFKPNEPVIYPLIIPVKQSLQISFLLQKFRFFTHIHFVRDNRSIFQHKMPLASPFSILSIISPKKGRPGCLADFVEVIILK
ncbi:MAG: hypothetical protein A2942_01145 [Candidatus Lloydbacteria bacterium RIFCSPLOWO2_01_FULL_50_20]|uniref:Uncharacterized protein n=1 Tax=Candidatus Lloydbacteria bacterium RIFCSPLOWO2_01_FULL_50_20 TaxID=1798665 RepID=A0A1G2DIC6_9BACT|nr:MAG: hypothetical protein A3C13_00055 [Candidatus Lloydbacteria bacterium RIFCSPHIGHO2_02_FULL_50_11]OGZ13434.1 MAG: hypothetical protein A2942_01145 [Candidatus Lloydbacteria bacterium RIFCSPLOWO2_01_FULL_50_20]